MSVRWQDVLTVTGTASRRPYWEAFVATNGENVEDSDLEALAKCVVKTVKDRVDNDELLPLLHSAQIISRTKGPCTHFHDDKFFEFVHKYCNVEKLVQEEEVAFRAFCVACNTMNHFRDHTLRYMTPCRDSLFSALANRDFQPTAEERNGGVGRFTLVCLSLMFSMSDDPDSLSAEVCMKYRDILASRLRELLPSKNTKESKWKQPNYFTYLLGIGVTLTRLHGDHMHKLFLPALFSFFYTETNEVCHITPAFMYALIILVLVFGSGLQNLADDDDPPPLFPVASKVAEITAKFIMRYYVEDDAETQRLLKRDNVLGTFEELISPGIVYMSILTSVLEDFSYVLEPAYIDIDENGPSSKKPRSPKFAQLMASAQYPLIAPSFAQIMLAVSHNNLGLAIDRFGVGACAGLLANMEESARARSEAKKTTDGEKTGSAQDSNDTSENAEKKRPLATVTVHDPNEEDTHNSIALDTLLKALEEVERNRVVEADYSDCD